MVPKCSCTQLVRMVVVACFCTAGLYRWTVLPGLYVPQKLVGMTPEGGGPSHSQCALCREVIRHRVSGLPRAEPPTHCMRNESWCGRVSFNEFVWCRDGPGAGVHLGADVRGKMQP